jgi:hypothetical protein
MKKSIFLILITLIIFGLCFTSCDTGSGSDDSIDGPTAKLQGRWYVLGNEEEPLCPDAFKEFSGNTMREYNNGHGGKYGDYLYTYTCTDTIITLCWAPYGPEGENIIPVYPIS